MDFINILIRGYLLANAIAAAAFVVYLIGKTARRAVIIAANATARQIAEFCYNTAVAAVMAVIFAVFILFCAVS